MITTDVDRERDLTVYTVSGRIADREAAFALLASCERSPTRYSLWDLRNASGETLDPDEVRWLASTMARHSSLRKGGKAALVAPQELEHSLVELGKSAFDDGSPAYDLAVFRDMDAALAWLGVPATSGTSPSE